MNKKILILLSAVLIGLWVLPSFAISGPSIDQVQKNVEALWKPLKKDLPSVTAVEFKKIKDSGKEFILLDVRQEDEYNAAHLPGAINISRGLLEWITPKKIQNTDAKIYVYCRTGARSAFAVKRLTEMGYTDVTNIDDSFKGWVEAGYPVYNRHGEFVMTSGGFEKKE